MTDVHRRRALQALLGLLVLTLACGLSATPPPPSPGELPATGPAVAATAPPFAGTPAPVDAARLPAGNRFAAYPQSAAAAPESPAQPGPAVGDVSKVEELEILDAGAQEQLFAVGFVVQPTPYNNFIEAYDDLSRQELPFFISSDLILHAFQVVSDVTWQQIQARYLAADLDALSKAMVDASLAQWQEAVDEGAPADELAEATWRNLAFFSVAARLQDPAFEPPATVAEIVGEELTLMEQGAVFNSPLFQRSEDYAQYAPPDPYAVSKALAGYYRAMIWLARPLALQGEDVQQVRRAGLQAVQMARAVEASQNQARWERVYHTTAYFQGAQNSWSLLEVQAAAQAVYGQDLQATELTNGLALDNFIATLQALPESERPLVAGLVGGAESARPPQFSFMPAAQLPDDSVLRQLTFNRVGVYQLAAGSPPTAVETEIGMIRALPRSLDLPAALGGELAWELLQESAETGYEGYTTQMTRLQAAYADAQAASWSTSHAGALLYALQPLLQTPAPGGPFLMQSELWGHKLFNSWYGGWTNARHRTTLAPRPVRAVAVEAQADFAYLEPQPVLYARLAAQTQQMIDGLEERGLLEGEAAQKLPQLQRFLEGLATISNKELAGERLTEDEMLLLTQAVPRVANLTTFEPSAEGEAPLTDVALARLVDVYRDESSGRLLQAGLGEAWPVYVLVPHDSQLVLAAGAVFSGYELIGEQLRPSDWQSMEERPAPAPWAQPYVSSP